MITAIIIVTSDNDRANLLNDYFASVCTIDDDSKPAFDRVVEDDCNVDSVDQSINQSFICET